METGAAGTGTERPHVLDVSPSQHWTDLGTRAGIAIRDAFATCCREHRVLLCLAFGYIVIGGLVLTMLGRRWPIQVTNRVFALVWISMSLAWLVWQWCRNPRRFLHALSGPRLSGALLVTVLVVPTQITFQAIKQSIGPVLGFHADPLLHRLDVLLHRKMAWMWFEPLLMNVSVVRTLDFLYMAWFGLLIVFFFWMSWSRARALRQRSMVAVMLLWIGAGTAAAWTAPSAGPCYYGHVVSGEDPYAPLITRLDAIEAEQQRPLQARRNQRGLWELRQADAWAQFAGISAMPSLHVGVAVLVALIAWQRSWLLGLVAISYAAAIQVGSVVLAWHYAVDGYLGAILAVSCWRAAGALVRWDWGLDPAFSAGAMQLPARRGYSQPGPR